MVKSSSNVRIKCYIILLGLEHSLAESITRNYDTAIPSFLTPDEQTKSLDRLREDRKSPNIQINDLDSTDLLTYLDLGDLVNILNRHISSVKNIHPEHIKAATRVIHKSGTLSIRKRVMHPIRPLEADDLPNLINMSKSIQSVAPSLIWDPLAINMRRQFREGDLLEVTIPPYYAEDSLYQLPNLMILDL